MTSELDLRSYTNHFDKTKDVRSILKHGDPQACPNPLLSVVIPTCKRANLLKYAVESALNQVRPFCEYEVLVVDNEASGHGTSQTYSLMKQFDDPRVLYYQNEQNIGIYWKYVRFWYKRHI